MSKTEEKPNEPGLWTREGKFYRVWFPLGAYDLVVAEITAEGFELGKHAPPTGNWRKLTAEPATVASQDQSIAEFTKWLTKYHPDVHNEVTLKAAEVFGSAGPSPPAVIEGKGQVVTEEQVGDWLVIIEGGCTPAVRFLGLRGVFNKGYRYMRCPTFPPRATFTAPAKPDLVLVRWLASDRIEWITVHETTSTEFAFEVIDPTTGMVIQGE